MADLYEVILNGGGPWGIRLQGGKDFGVQLNIARVTPGSKAAMKNMLAGDSIMEINGTETESLTHMEAQNLIKNSGSTLQMKLKQGKGISLGDVKQVGSGALGQGTGLYKTTTVHSAGVDHKYNAKPKAFVPSSGSATKFDPAEYARKKKEELDNYKAQQNKAPVPDSDVLKMLQQTKIEDSKPPFAYVQGPNATEEAPGNFRMVAGRDLSEVQAHPVIEDIKVRGKSGLGNQGVAGTGSRSFKMLEQIINNEEQEDDLPPPPPELIDEQPWKRQTFGSSGPSTQSKAFQMLNDSVERGDGDQVPTGLGGPISPGTQGKFTVKAPSFNAKAGSSQPTPVSAIPKAPTHPLSGPNFKIGGAAAPTFKPNPVSSQPPPPPAPVPVNRIPQDLYDNNFSSNKPNNAPPPRSPGYSQGPPPPSSGMPAPPTNRIMTKGAPQPVPAPASQSNKELLCHACQQPLTGPFVSAIGKTWHPDHFCCSSCKTSLQNQAFVEESNQLFCENCYNQYYAPKCAHCNNAIIGNCINALGKSWHPDHFICTFCSRNFGSDGFLVDSGKPYCEKCFEDLFSVKCGKCQRPITGGEKYVEALNKNWHSNCFACSVCNTRLEGNSFFVNRGMPYCQHHKSGQ